MWSKILTSIGVELARRLANIIVEFYRDWRGERAIKKEINTQVKILLMANTPDEIRAALSKLNL